MSGKRMVTVNEMFEAVEEGTKKYGTGFNTEDGVILDAVQQELTQAWFEARTQRQAMEHLLFAKHLLETLLRQMQDS